MIQLLDGQPRSDSGPFSDPQNGGRLTAQKHAQKRPLTSKTQWPVLSANTSTREKTSPKTQTSSSHARAGRRDHVGSGHRGDPNVFQNGVYIHPQWHRVIFLGRTTDTYVCRVRLSGCLPFCMIVGPEGPRGGTRTSTHTHAPQSCDQGAWHKAGAKGSPDMGWHCHAHASFLSSTSAHRGTSHNPMPATRTTPRSIHKVPAILPACPTLQRCLPVGFPLGPLLRRESSPQT